MQLDNGQIGLIDYGQTRRIDDEQRIAFSRIVVALNENAKHNKNAPAFNATAVAGAMRNAGFATRDNTDDAIITQYARLLFDSDEESEKQGFSIPQVCRVRGND